MLEVELGHEVVMGFVIVQLGEHAVMVTVVGFVIVCVFELTTIVVGYGQ